MTKYPAAESPALPAQCAIDLDAVEADISNLNKESFTFPGAQYFSAIMLGEMPQNKLAKFRAPRETGE